MYMKFEIILIVSCNTSNCFFGRCSRVQSLHDSGYCLSGRLQTSSVSATITVALFFFFCLKKMTLQYKNLEKMIKLFVLNLIQPLFLSDLQMVSFYVCFLAEQLKESGPCYNMYHPQHYLLHELPIINENHCCDIIRG